MGIIKASQLVIGWRFLITSLVMYFMQNSLCIAALSQNKDNINNKKNLLSSTKISV